jgi:aminomethyltransferase
MERKTALHDRHVALDARMVPYAGWQMPLDYGSQIAEHHAVRRDAGMFDVSHMCVIDIDGANARRLLESVLANDVGRLTEPGQALYSCMLREDAGVVDDLIVYFVVESRFRIVANASRRARDLEWLRERARPHGVDVRERADLAMIAVQGPRARDKAVAALPAEARSAALALEPFRAATVGDLFIARTGYTGEDGWELVVPAARAADLWDALRAAGLAPAGLAARDTLRLEAGMNLYGADMDETRHPLESGLGWTVAWQPSARDFVGRAALATIRATGGGRKLVGLVLEERGVLRAGQKVTVPDAELEAGAITSGTFSPTLGRSIAFARVPAAVRDRVVVDVRGKPLAARVVKPPFVRRGHILV